MDLRIEAAETAEGWARPTRLIRAYLAELPFEIDFQDLDRELAELAGRVRPARRAPSCWPGRPTAAPAQSGSSGVAASPTTTASSSACTSTRPVAASGAGRALAVGRGRRRPACSATGALLLDTVASLTRGHRRSTSRSGFVEIAAYRHNPRPDARYFALDL